MELIPLTQNYELTAFDCGDDDLNAFLLNDAKKAVELRIANTFISRRKRRTSTLASCSSI